MAHRVSSQAATDLDDIWYHVAEKSGSIAVANHLIDSITDRFFLLAAVPTWVVLATTILVSGSRSFPVNEYVIAYWVEDKDVLIPRWDLCGQGDITPP